MTEQLRLLDDDRPQPMASGDQAVVIRESRRAKTLILQTIPPYTLELVVPRGTRPRDVEEFLSSNRSWIERAQTELRSRYPEDKLGLPITIEFPAVDRCWQVSYERASVERLRLQMSSGDLHIVAPENADRQIQKLLRRWLLAQARLYLKPWLAEEAGVVGVRPNKIQVRTQRTRWGSCSPRSNISLNASLLFLDHAVARYLLIHELCHLRYLDHSARYWRCVERFEADYRNLDKRLTDSWSAVPVWALTR